MTPAQAIRRALIDASVCVDSVESPSADWPVFVAALPDGAGAKDNAVAVYDTSGVMDGRYMRMGTNIEHPGIQVRVRSTSYTDGWSKIVAIAAALEALLRTVVVVDSESTTIQNVTRKGTPISLGPEPQNRRRVSFTINAIVTLV